MSIEREMLDVIKQMKNFMNFDLPLHKLKSVLYSSIGLTISATIAALTFKYAPIDPIPWLAALTSFGGTFAFLIAQFRLKGGNKLVDNDYALSKVKLEIKELTEQLNSIVGDDPDYQKIKTLLKSELYKLFQMQIELSNKQRALSLKKKKQNDPSMIDELKGSVMELKQRNDDLKDEVLELKEIVIKNKDLQE